MASTQVNWSKTATVFGATAVAAATIAAMNVVSYFNGNTYTNGTAEATTMSGTVVTAGGGLQTIGASGPRFTTVEADTLSGGTLRNTSGTWTVTNAGVSKGLSYSGSTTLTLDSAGDRKNKVACWGTGGTIGFCTNTPAATVCSCFVP